MDDLILVEATPSLIHRKEIVLVELIMSMEKTRIPLDWDEIVQLQTMNLKNGLNRVGIPDMIIAHNDVQNRIWLFSLDRHAGIAILLYSVKYINDNYINISSFDEKS